MTVSLTDRFRLMARAGQQAKTPILAEVTAPKLADGVATLRLYDVIDSWGGPYGISAKEFAAVLDDLPDDTTEIRLHISSPGGEVWDGLAILNSLRQHPARVVTIVDGIAASAASVVAMAGDEVLVAPGSEFMVHAAWGLCVGNATDMAKMTDTLQHESDNLAGIYAAKAGGTVEDWRAVMTAETWYTADEAVAAGLADRVLAVEGASAADGQKAKARFDLSVFAYAGRDAAPAPHILPAVSAAGSAAPRGTTREESAVSDTLLTGLRERLGTAEDADEATVLAALDESLAEQAEPTPGPTPTDPTPPRSPEVPPAALAEVARLSTELAELKAQASARTKAEHFAAWQREGKTSPAEVKGTDGKNGLAAMYDAAPEQTVALIGARAKGSAVPLAAIGHDSDPDEPLTLAAIQETDAYKNWSI